MDASNKPHLPDDIAALCRVGYRRTAAEELAALRRPGAAQRRNLSPLRRRLTRKAPAYSALSTWERNMNAETELWLQERLVDLEKALTDARAFILLLDPQCDVRNIDVALNPHLRTPADPQ